jgi:hypothetical protein
MAADLTGDDKPDLVFANSADKTVRVMINQGSGALAAPVAYAMGDYFYSAAAADLTGDGLPDLAVLSASAVAVLANEGSGTFAAPVTYPIGAGPRTIKTADRTGDGVPDLVVVLAGFDVNVLALQSFGGLQSSSGSCSGLC